MNIILADDHKLIRDGLVPFLQELNSTVHILEAETFAQLLDIGARTQPLDLIITDLRMPGMKGVASLRDIVDAHPNTPVVVLSGTTDPVVAREALDVGIRGYIPKSAGSKIMLNALNLVLSGETYMPVEMLSAPIGVHSAEPNSPGFEADHARRFKNLSPREAGVLSLLATGLTNKQIASSVGVQESTVKIHVKNIYRKIGAANRAQAVRMALQPSWPG